MFIYFVPSFEYRVSFLYDSHYKNDIVDGYNDHKRSNDHDILLQQFCHLRFSLTLLEMVYYLNGYIMGQFPFVCENYKKRSWREIVFQTVCRVLKDKTDVYKVYVALSWIFFMMTVFEFYISLPSLNPTLWNAWVFFDMILAGLANTIRYLNNIVTELTPVYQISTE